MDKTFSQFLAESKVFTSKEDNPLIYTLIIPKLVQYDGCKDTVKDDKALFELVNKVEKLMSKLDVKQLKKLYNPVVMFNVFEQESTKKATKEFVLQYFTEFEQQIAGEEVTFEGAYKIHSAFKQLKDSEEFKAYLQSL